MKREHMLYYKNLVKKGHLKLLDFSYKCRDKEDQNITRMMTAKMYCVISRINDIFSINREFSTG